MTTLVTVGHGSLDQPSFAALLRGADVGLLVDVRRFPGSRAHPHVARDALAQWLPEHHVAYAWEPRLGGRRSALDGDTDAWWKVRAFRAYAAHLRSTEARGALAEVLEGARDRRTAVLCSEAVWWRCHRRLVADTAVLGHAVDVLHLDHRGGLTAHVPAGGAVVGADGLVRYPSVPAG